MLGLLSPLREFLQSHYQETACLRTAALPGDGGKKIKFRVTIEADDLVPSSAEAPEGNIVPKGSSSGHHRIFASYLLISSPSPILWRYFQGLLSQHTNDQLPPLHLEDGSQI